MAIVRGRPGKAADAHVKYGFTWAKWLAKQRYTAADIVSVTWTVPAGLTKTEELLNGAEAIVWLAGGTPGQTYDVVCRIEMPPPGEGDPAVADERVLKVRVF